MSYFKRTLEASSLITIDRKTFRETYAGTSILNDEELFFTKPSSPEDLVKNYLPSKLWRLNNLYHIVNKWGQLEPMRMNLSQHKVYATLMEHPRIIILKSRQQGISTFFLAHSFDTCLVQSNMTTGLQANGSEEAETLMTRTKLMWDWLDEDIKLFFGVELDKDNTREFTFNNNSSLLVRTSFRSATLQQLHVSELAKLANKAPQRAKETKTGTLQAIAKGNVCVIESTAEGDNLFKDMWDTATQFSGNLTDKDFKPMFLSWVYDADCNLSIEQEIDSKSAEYFAKIEEELGVVLTRTQKNFWIAQKRELGDDIHQEYPATAGEAFLTNKEGTYYSAYYLRLVKNRGREVSGLFDKNLPVQVAVDLGRNDSFVLLFFQTFLDGWRIINSYDNSGLGIKHYCEIMDTLKETEGYDISTIVLPHDAAVRDLTSDLTREEAFWKYGYTNTLIVDRTKSVGNDIELVRQALDRIYIDPKAQYIIDCFYNYKKEWDARLNNWKNVPAHDKYSHGADAIRQMVIGGIGYTPKVTREKRVPISGFTI